VIGIDSICRKLLKTVGILAVPLDLAKLRLKNHKKMSIFDQNLNPKKKPMYPLTKNEKLGQKINVP